MENDKTSDLQSIEAVKFPTYASLACYCKECQKVIPVDDARAFMAPEEAHNTIAAVLKKLEPNPITCLSCSHKDFYQALEICLYVLPEHK